MTQLKLTNDNLENQNVLIGIYHTHPEYVKKIISAQHLPNCPPNGTPFEVLHPDPVFIDVRLPFHEIFMKAVLVKMHNNSNLPMTFIMNSTDKKSKFEIFEKKTS